MFRVFPCSILCYVCTHFSRAGMHVTPACIAIWQARQAKPWPRSDAGIVRRGSSTQFDLPFHALVIPLALGGGLDQTLPRQDWSAGLSSEPQHPHTTVALFSGGSGRPLPTLARRRLVLPGCTTFPQVLPSG